MAAESCSVTNTSLEDASDSGEDGQKFRLWFMIIYLAPTLMAEIWLFHNFQKYLRRNRKTKI